MDYKKRLEIRAFINNNINEIKKKMQKIYDAKLTSEDVDYVHFPKPISIKEAGILASQNFTEDHKKKPALGLIGVVLSTNRDVATFVNDRIKHINNYYPNITTFKDLEKELSKFPQEEEELKNALEKFWKLKDIKRYNILKSLNNLIINMEVDDKNVTNDYEKMNEWANKFNIEKWEKDYLRIPGVALGTLQHLRMQFGVITVKPNRHVSTIINELFNIEANNDMDKIIAMEELAIAFEIEDFVLDKIFFKYGASGYLKLGKNI